MLVRLLSLMENDNEVPQAVPISQAESGNTAEQLSTQLWPAGHARIVRDLDAAQRETWNKKVTSQARLSALAQPCL